MNSYVQDYGEQVRLKILRLLDREEMGSIGDRSLTVALQDASYRHVTRDQVKGHVFWLAEQGLVFRDEDADDGTLFATISPRGSDVAQGRVRVPGVDFRRRGE